MFKTLLMKARLFIMILSALIIGYGGTCSDSNIPDVTTAGSSNTITPSIISSAAAVNFTSATLAGIIRPKCLTTTAYFQWGTTIDYGNDTISQTILPTMCNVAISDTLYSLTLSSTYYFRLVMQNVNGIIYGPGSYFSTAINSTELFITSDTQFTGLSLAANQEKWYRVYMDTLNEYQFNTVPNTGYYLEASIYDLYGSVVNGPDTGFYTSFYNSTPDIYYLRVYNNNSSPYTGNMYYYYSFAAY
jgi:hypothetical protein